MAERSDPWGEAAAPRLAATESATVPLLPVIRRVRALEVADLERATVRLGSAQRAGVALTFGLAIALWAPIFAPMERLLRPEVAARITDEVLYASASAEALALVDPAIRADPALDPPEAVMERLFLVRSRPPAEKAALARAWRRLPLGL